MTLHGKNLIGGNTVASGPATIRGWNPATGQALEPAFHAATAEEVQEAVSAAVDAFAANRKQSAEAHATLLERIATAIDALDDSFVALVQAETGLPEGRVRGERGRTTGQLRLFASVVREGSWVDARIDTALPDRAPIPKPDIRTMLMPLGPVAVFGASNFPLAFSVAGGDTASALAAGCPVVCKAHPAHPGTSEMVAGAIHAAVKEAGFHPGTFSLVHGGVETGETLVGAAGIKAVGFTGSQAAGMALHKIAAARPTPIPVFAEMGSVNPVFLLRDALATRPTELAKGLAGSVTLGSGQFCTNPGLVFAEEGPGLNTFLDSLETAVAATTEQTMLHAGIAKGYSAGRGQLAATSGVSLLAEGTSDTNTAAGAATGLPTVFQTDTKAFLANPHLAEEVFGPASIIVRCKDTAEMRQAVEALSGNLTATLHANSAELGEQDDLISLLADRVGRLIVNGFPTGVEVCHSMHHGGPFPATTDARWTSVGTAAIRRFARPLCFQGFPEERLPVELVDANPRDLMRTVNGTLTRGTV